MGLKTKEMYHKNKLIGFKVMMSTMGDESPFLGKRVKRSKRSKRKKLLFQLVFSTYLLVYSPKFRSWALVGWGIQFCIQCIPTWHTFGGPWCLKNEKYMKKRDDDVEIEFPMQRVLPIKIWVNTQWDMLKIWVEK